MSASLLGGEQHAHVITGDKTMSTSKAKSFAKATGKLALAATVAALWMAAGPIAGAAADGYPGSAARATALQACSGPVAAWGCAYRACMAPHGQAEELRQRLRGLNPSP